MKLTCNMKHHSVEKCLRLFKWCCEIQKLFFFFLFVTVVSTAVLSHDGDTGVKREGARHTNLAALRCYDTFTAAWSFLCCDLVLAATLSPLIVKAGSLSHFHFFVLFFTSQNCTMGTNKMLHIFFLCLQLISVHHCNSSALHSAPPYFI